MVCGIGATGFVLREDLAPAMPFETAMEPAAAATHGDPPPVGFYPPEAPAVTDAQVLPSDTSRSGTRPSAPVPDDSSRSLRTAQAPLPARSGKGRRIVFSMSEQRVWLVRKDGTVTRTYLGSGSKTDNLDPGSYEVYSRSRHATSYDLGSTMEYFVRFTQGANAPIGFHTIPVDDAGEPLQTRAQLGTPLSSGCIRQRSADAIALWGFAPIGTKVVVVA